MAPKRIPLAAATKVTEPLSLADLKKLVAPGLGSAARPVLDDWGYNGGAAAYLGLTLDSSNLLVEHGDLFLVGQLYSEDTVVSMQGDKLWRDCASTVKFQMTFKNLGMFQFKGKLASDFIPLETFDPKLLVNNDEVNEDDFKAAGGGDACLRATVYPEAPDYVRLIITVFPLARADLCSRFTNADTGGLPGAKLVSEVIPVVPNKCKKWGLAFLPVIVTGAVAASLSSSIVFQMKKAVHFILSKGVKPIGASSPSSVAAKWDSFADDEPVPSAPLPFAWQIPAEFLEQPSLEEQGRLSVDGLDRNAIARRVGMEDDNVSVATELTIIELDQESDEEEPPSKRKRSTPGSGTSKSKSAPKQKKGKEKSHTNTDMWSIMESGIWVAADRPPGQFQDRDWINSQSYETLSMMKKDLLDGKRESGAASDCKYKVDSMPPRRNFAAGVDDCNESTHEARYQRRPLCSEEQLWLNVPYRLDHVYKNLDLSLCGADSQISERTIGIMHDRTVPLHLKYFHRKNATVTWQPLVEERRRTKNDQVSSVVDYDWQEMDSMAHVQDAIINYAIVQSYLFPYDFTGLCLLKLYNLYGYLPYGNEKERVRMIADHFYRVSCANISRAARGRPPLDFTGQESVLKKVLQDESLPREPPSKANADRKSLDDLCEKLFKGESAEQGGNGQPRGQGKPQGRYGGQGRNQAQGRTQGQRQNNPAMGGRTPDGKLLCYNYNDGQCTRMATKNGCVGRNNREFLHFCNAWSQQKNALCLGPHPKSQHK